MSEWHYLSGGTIIGPISAEALLARLESGTLSMATPVRPAQRARWTRAGLVREFEQALYPLRAAPWPAFDAAPPASAHPAGATVPWPRCLARCLDVSLFAAVCTPGLALIPARAGETVQDLLGFVVLLAYTVVEAAALSLAGTTPGRALLGIRLRTAQGGRPSFDRALSRSLAVWLKGLAAGIAPLVPIAAFLAYRRLQRHGVTSWDESGRFVIEHRAVGRWHYAAALAAFAAAMVVAVT